MASSPIVLPLFSVRFPHRDDSYNRLGLSVAMTNNQHPKSNTHSQKNEPFLRLGMIWIAEHLRIFVMESRDGLIKGNPMLCEVATGLDWVPDESKITHTYIVCIIWCFVNTASVRRTSASAADASASPAGWRAACPRKRRDKSARQVQAVVILLCILEWRYGAIP